MTKTAASENYEPKDSYISFQYIDEIIDSCYDIESEPRSSSSTNTFADNHDGLLGTVPPHPEYNNENKAPRYDYFYNPPTLVKPNAAVQPRPSRTTVRTSHPLREPTRRESKKSGGVSESQQAESQSTKFDQVVAVSVQIQEPRRRRPLISRLGSSTTISTAKMRVISVQMPWSSYLRDFARDDHGNYTGTEPYRLWTAEEIDDAFGRYKAMDSKKLVTAAAPTKRSGFGLGRRSSKEEDLGRSNSPVGGWGFLEIRVDRDVSVDVDESSSRS